MNTEKSRSTQNVGWLVSFFGLAYFMQHFGQFGLIMQPLQFYFKETMGFNAEQTTAYLSVLTIPWMIKPLYGLISDFVPLFGYRRKSYLILLNTLSAVAFVCLMGMATPSSIVMVMVIASIGTAASDVIIDALMVELGNKTGQTKVFQSQQWLWYNVAAILTGVCGGYLSDWFGASAAVRWAALVTAFAPATVVFSSWYLVKEEKVRSNVSFSAVLTAFKRLWVAVRTRSLWTNVKFVWFGFWAGVVKMKTLIAVAAFLVFWEFSPSVGTPMYYYQTNVLKFDQSFIGWLGAASSLAAVAGALYFRLKLAKQYSTKQLLTASAILGVIGTLSYLLIADNFAAAWLAQYVSPMITSMVLSVVFGVVAIVAFLTTLNLAAEACPGGAEGLTFALLMSASNFAKQGSSILGGSLYTRYFNESLSPLIVVSAAFTLVCLLIIPFLPKLDAQKEEEKPAQT